MEVWRTGKGCRSGGFWVGETYLCRCVYFRLVGSFGGSSIGRSRRCLRIFGCSVGFYIYLYLREDG